MNRIKKWEQNCEVLKDKKFLAKYAVQEKIVGEGSFGTVFIAKLRINQEERAVKAIRRIEKVDMLAIELKLLTELGGHFNIVKFYDFYHILGSVIVVMEYFPHCTGLELVMHARSDHTFPLLYFRNLMIALSYLHQNGFVHRDVKLSNFLYSKETQSFRLVDFGLATADRSDVDKTRETNRKSDFFAPECTVCGGQPSLCIICKSMTKRDNYQVVGTPGVRAPELLIGIGSFCTPVDIFSSGIVLLSLLCAKHPLFMPRDETENIMNLACLLGSEALEKMGAAEGIRLTVSTYKKPMDFCKFILAMRYGLRPLRRCKKWIKPKKCQDCANLGYRNVNRICFCREGSEKGKFDTRGIDSDLLILYVDLLYYALEADRYKRYNANQLLSVIEYYDKRTAKNP